MSRRRILLSAAGLFFAAVVGGAVALGGAAVSGKLDGKTVEIRQVSTPSGEVSLSGSGQGLTIPTLYRLTAPGVVQITSTSVVSTPSDPFFGDIFPPQQQEQRSLGSGFVIDKDGHIVTNYHVVAGARNVQVSFSKNEQVDATVVGSDPSTDIAVLKVDTSSRALTPLALGDSDKLQVGDQVVAIGNPFGLFRTATAGIVSALGRPITAPNNFTIDHAIQTDAPINHGNSGGPLLSLAGQVVGVNSQISTGSTGEQGNVGIGFAVPINTVKNVVADILRSGKVEHAFIGIGVEEITPDLAKLFKLPVDRGLLVDSVRGGSAGAKAGLEAGKDQVTVNGQTYVLGGDVILEADGRTTATGGDLRDIVARKHPGDSLKLELYRGTKRTTVTVKLGRQPSLSPVG